MKLYVNDQILTVRKAPISLKGSYWRIRLEEGDGDKITFPVTGDVILRANGGLIMAQVNSAAYAYSYMDGQYLVLSNDAPPEPEPEPEPTDESDADAILNALLGVTE